MDVCDGCCRTVPSIVVDEETSWEKNDLCKDVFNGCKDAARIPLFVAAFNGVDDVFFLLFNINRPPNGEREGREVVVVAAVVGFVVDDDDGVEFCEAEDEVDDDALMMIQSFSSSLLFKYSRSETTTIEREKEKEQEHRRKSLFFFSGDLSACCFDTPLRARILSLKRSLFCNNFFFSLLLLLLMRG